MHQPLRGLDFSKEKPSEIMERISNFIEEIHLETGSQDKSPLKNNFLSGDGVNDLPGAGKLPMEIV